MVGGDLKSADCTRTPTHTHTHEQGKALSAEGVRVLVCVLPRTIEPIFVSVGMKLSTESYESDREREFVCACACVLLQKKRSKKKLMRSKNNQQNQYRNRINKVMELIFVKNYNGKKSIERVFV